MIPTTEKDLHMVLTTHMEEEIPNLTKMTQILWVDVVQGIIIIIIIEVIS
jgi:hypothetical protein